MRSTTRARMVLVAAAATMACGLGGVASAPAFANVPPGGGGGGADCMPLNDSVTFSGSKVTFKAHAWCDEVSTLNIWGGKGVNETNGGHISKTCTLGDTCTYTLTIKTSGSGSYCMRSANDLQGGQVPSSGYLCQTH